MSDQTRSPNPIDSNSGIDLSPTRDDEYPEWVRYSLDQPSYGGHADPDARKKRSGRKAIIQHLESAPDNDIVQAFMRWAEACGVSASQVVRAYQGRKEVIGKIEELTGQLNELRSQL